jgi:hypothetical protein
VPCLDFLNNSCQSISGRAGLIHGASPLMFINCVFHANAADYLFWGTGSKTLAGCIFDIARLSQTDSGRATTSRRLFSTVMTNLRVDSGACPWPDPTRSKVRPRLRPRLALQVQVVPRYRRHIIHVQQIYH